MITIVSKFTDSNNTIQALRLVDDGVTDLIHARGVYNKFYFYELLDAGYVFRDYYLDIVGPDGINLKDLPEDEEVITSTKLEELATAVSRGMLDEKELLDKFVVDTQVVGVEFKVPNEDDIKIFTKEDLSTYIRQTKLLNVSEFIPINSFVSPDALFDIDDIVKNTNDAVRDVYTYLDSTLSIRSLDDYERFKETYGILDDEGVEKSLSKILDKVLEYGIPLINCKVIKITKSMSAPELQVINTLHAHYETAPFTDATYISAYDKEVSDRLGLPEPLNIQDYDNLKFIRGGLVPYNFYSHAPSLYIDCISSTGIKFTVVMSAHRFLILGPDGKQRLTPIYDLFNVVALDDTRHRLSVVLENGWDYITERTMVNLHLINLFKNKKVEPYYKNTKEVLQRAGVSLNFIPSQVVRLITENRYSDIDSSEIKEFSSRHYDLMSKFKNGFSKEVISKYGAEDLEEQFSLSEIYEYISNVVEDLKENGAYLVRPEETHVGGIKTPEFEAWEREYYRNELGCISLVYEILQRGYTVGDLMSGKLSDGGFPIIKSINVLMSLRKKTKDISIFEFLQNYKDVIDLEGSIAEQYGAFNGAISDLIYSLNEYYGEADKILSVKKLFREIANKSDNHYAFEAIAFSKEKGTIGGKVFEQIRTMIENLVAVKFDMARELVPSSYYASNLIFGIRAGEVVPQANGLTRLDGEISYRGKFSIELKISPETYTMIKADNGQMFYRVFSSVFEFVNKQFYYGGDFKFYCKYAVTNGYFTPWQFNLHSDSKSIPVYNTAVNAMDQMYLNASYRPETIGSHTSPDRRIYGDNFQRLFHAQNLFSGDVDFLDSIGEGYVETDAMTELKNTITGKYLYDGCAGTEGVNEYFIYNFYNLRELASKGLYVDRLQSKSDLEFSNLYALIEDNCEAEEPRPVMDGDNPMGFIADTMVRNLGVTKTAITSNENYSVIKFDDLPEGIITNSEFMVNNFISGVPMLLRGQFLRVDSDRFNLSALKKEDAEKFVNIGIAVQINHETYVIRYRNYFIKVVTIDD